MELYPYCHYLYIICKEEEKNEKKKNKKFEGTKNTYEKGVC